jgi:hypothetical protein
MQSDDDATTTFLGHQSPNMNEYHAIIRRLLKRLISCVSIFAPGRVYHRFVKPLFEEPGTQDTRSRNSERGEWIAIEKKMICRGPFDNTSRGRYRLRGHTPKLASKGHRNRRPNWNAIQGCSNMVLTLFPYWLTG